MYRRIAISTLAIAALGLAACGGDTTPEPGDPVQVTPTVQETVEATQDDAATTDDTAGTADATTPAEATAVPMDPALSTETPTDDVAAPSGEHMEQVGSALQAIQFAEAETGGVAYKIDDEDSDRAWEVTLLRPEGNAIEVKVNREGTEVLSTEDEDTDLSAPPATTIQDAIGAAVAHTPGLLDDAELDEDDGQLYWEVTIEQDGNDVDVYLDAANLQVIQR